MFINSKSILKEVVTKDAMRVIKKNKTIAKSNREPHKPMNYVFVHRGLKTKTTSFKRVVESYKKFFKEEKLPFIMFEWDEGCVMSYELFEYIYKWNGPEMFTIESNIQIDLKIRKILKETSNDYTQITDENLRLIYNTLKIQIETKDAIAISVDNIGKICVGASFESMRVLIPRCDRGHIEFGNSGPLPEFLREKHGSQSTMKRSLGND